MRTWYAVKWIIATPLLILQIAILVLWWAANNAVAAIILGLELTSFRASLWWNTSRSDWFRKPRRLKFFLGIRRWIG